MPKPDLAIGIKPSAFSEGEIAKIKIYTAPNRPTLFTDNMYFPFLLGDVESTRQSINRADCQNMHSGSLAVDALIQFIQSVDSAADLSGEVLVIFISHDNNRTRI